MKQKTTSLFAIGILALVISTSTAYATNTVRPQHFGTAKAEVQRAKKIIISGNVEVTLVQDGESRKLYTNDGAVSVSVSEIDNIIYVSTRKNCAPAKITLYLDNISRIIASGNATVKNKHTLKLQYLQIILKDKAAANINAETESLYTKLINESALTLSGNTETFFISTNELAQLETSNFEAGKTDIERRHIGYTKIK